MSKWLYTPSKSTQQTLSESLGDFPREKDISHSLIRLGWNILLRSFLRCYFRLEIRGKENLPKDQSYLLIANHSSHLDSLCLSAAIPLKKVSSTYSIAAKEYFFSSFGRRLFSSIFINAIPFDRHQEKRKSLTACAETLNQPNQVLIMFPEGTRAANGEMQPFKKGIGILTAGTPHPVVPAYIQDAHLAWPKHSLFMRPKKITIIIGEPLSFSSLEKTAESYETIASVLQSEVRCLKDRLGDPSC